MAAAGPDEPSRQQGPHPSAHIVPAGINVDPPEATTQDVAPEPRSPPGDPSFTVAGPVHLPLGHPNQYQELETVIATFQDRRGIQVLGFQI